MKILVAPLNWGIGHATRCVPLIHILRTRGHEVILGADGKSLEFLQGVFPGLVCRRFPDLNIRYAKSRRGFVAVMVRQLPQIMINIRRENRTLREWVSEWGIQGVISDNRYGLHHEKCRCYLMTHQLHIVLRSNKEGGGQSGFPERLLAKLLARRLSRFREVWVPDYGEQPNLAGSLSMPLPGLNIRYIGPLSRLCPSGDGSGPRPFVDRSSKMPFSPVSGGANLKTPAKAPHEKLPLKILAIISGPEPQRSMLEEIIRDQLRRIPGPHVMVTGALDGRDPVRVGDLTVYSHAGAEELACWITSAEIVVARSGYSTIMDLACLGAKQVLFIPTPGQTEQEYLAGHLQRLQVAPFRRQSALGVVELSKLTHTFIGYSGFGEFKDRPRDAGEVLEEMEVAGGG